MPIKIDKQRFIFRTMEIWFSDYPYDVSGYHSVLFRDCKNKVDLKGFARREFPTMVIDLSLDYETLWRNIKKATRKDIRRAQSLGVRVLINEGFEEFYQLNRRFRRQKGLSPHPEAVELTEKFGKLFTTFMDNELLGATVFLEDETTMRGLIACSRRLEVGREKANVIGRANKLLAWESIKYAKEKGLKEYDLGGYYTGGDANDPRSTINFFKRQFGGKIVSRYVYSRDYSRLYTLARNLHRIKNMLFGEADDPGLFTSSA